jgi:hypothetical protein
MEELKKALKLREIEIDAKDRRIMCFAHIIDLCSGRVVRAASDGVEDNSDEDDSSESSPGSDNPIAQARAVVRAIRGSGTRRTSFQDTIEHGNTKRLFRQGQSLEAVRVEPLQLLRDVRTRWDSVFLMLRRLREMRPVCIYTLLNVMPAN